MPLSRKDYSNFIYIWYHRQEPKDINRLKQHVSAVINDPSDSRDVVVDFSSCKGLLPSEMPVLVTLLKSFSKTPRHIRIVTNPRVEAAIQAVNLFQFGNLIVYQDQKNFIQQAKSIGCACGNA